MSRIEKYRKILKSHDERDDAERRLALQSPDILRRLRQMTNTEIARFEAYLCSEEGQLAKEVFRREGKRDVDIGSTRRTWGDNHDYKFGARGLVRDRPSDISASTVDARTFIRDYVESRCDPSPLAYSGFVGWWKQRRDIRLRVARDRDQLLAEVNGLSDRCVALIRAALDA